MTETFDFGDPPYDWDEFERFIDWWVGKTEPVFDSARVDKLPVPEVLKRYLADIERVGLPRYDGIDLPTEDDFLDDGRIRIGGREGGDCFSLFVNGDDPELLVEDSEGPGGYPTLQEVLVTITMRNLYEGWKVKTTQPPVLDSSDDPRRPSDELLDKSTWLLEVAPPISVDEEIVMLHGDTLFVATTVDGVTYADRATSRLALDRDV